MNTLRRGLRKSMSLSVMIAAGALLAVIPATSQAIAARLMTTDEQALLAISVSAGAFLAAILNAITLEARLSQPDLRERSYLPLWSVALGVLGSLICVIASFASASLLIYGLPMIMVSLQVGRTHAITEARNVNEGIGGLVLLVGALTAFGLSLIESSFAVGALGIGALGTILLRAYKAPLRASQRVRIRNSSWVGLETAVVASTPLLINVTILLQLGAEQAIAFRLILTTLGVLQPLLGMLRTRLLSSATRGLSIALSALTVVALLVVLLLDVLGVFRAIFGESWQYVSFAALCLACLWKLLSIPQTFPFTSMRRRGQVGVVFVIRAASTTLFLVAGVTATLFGGTILVFAAFCAAEIATAVLYYAADFVSSKRLTAGRLDRQ